MPAIKYAANGCFWVGFALILSGPVLARSPPPSPDCMDARLIQEVRQPDADTLVILGSDDRRFRMELESGCNVAGRSESATLLAKEGWVCGLEREFVQVEGQICRVAGIRSIDPKEYAELSRISDKQAKITTLDTVEVRVEGRRVFGGSYSYCFNPRYMRAWSEDSKSLLVEMSPKRSGGNRYYRVELAHSCRELFSAPVIYFKSGVGIGLICANPGDQVVVVPEQGGFSSRGITRSSCPISAVYPLEQSKKRD